MTKKGYMGIGQNLLTTGNEIRVLPGCNTPLALRSTDDGFRLVGDCYTYGLMKGEVIQLVRDGTLRFRNIAIR